MPMIVSDHIWRQTNERISIRVPLHGIHLKYVDIFTAESYLKASFGRFLWEVFLWDKILLKESRCSLAGGEAVFDLVKFESGKDWPQLEKSLTKEEKKEVRQEAHRQVEGYLKEEAERRSLARTELQRQAVRQQMDLDEKQRNFIQKVKDTERAEAMLELENWKHTHNPKKALAKSSLTKSELKEKEERKKIFSQEEKKQLPPPRENGSIQVTFTAREFPTPLRESRKAEEDEWLSKQLAARRRAGFVAEDLTSEEQDPIWLKEKGDSFFEAGNYLGALSAYSHAINKCGGDQMPELYANRSNAHFVLGNLHKTVEDCSRALELLNPPVEANRVCRAKCYGRRGVALGKIGTASRGVPDLEMAVKLLPDDPALRSALESVQNAADNESSSTDDELN